MRIQKYRFWLLAIICMALLPLSSCSDEKATQAEDQKTAAQGTDTGEKPLTPIEREAGAGNGEANAVKPDERDEKQAADKASAATEKPESEKVTPATGEKMGDKNGQARMPVEKDLLHRRFELNSINGKAYDYKEKKPALEFNEGFQLAGHVCNRFMGKATLENGVLSAEHMAATKKFCFEEEINRLENNFLALMRNGAAAEFDGQRLVLRGKGMEEDIVLEYRISDWVQ